jgi:hypothetical protein
MRTREKMEDDKDAADRREVELRAERAMRLLQTLELQLTVDRRRAR